MVLINFLGPIKTTPLEVDFVSTLRDISEVLSKDPYLKNWLVDCTIAVNDVIVYDLETPIEDGDIVSVLPPVCGG